MEAYIIISILICWIFFAVVIGAVASTKGKDFGLWFFISFMLSPLVAGFCLVISLMPSKSSSDGSVTKDDFEEKWSTLVSYDEGTKNAVKQLEVYGSDAIDELKKVLRATNDPTRLPQVVNKIAKDIQLKHSEQAAREVQNKIDADRIRIAEQITKEANEVIWRKRSCYALLVFIALCIICGAFVVKIKAAREKAVMTAKIQMAAEQNRLIYTDQQTGLMWARNGNIAGKAMNWNDAMIWVNNLNYGGFSSWRLPSRAELESFTKRGGNHPSEWFNGNGFNNVQPYSFYWSSSSSTFTHNRGDGAWDVKMAWYVKMDSGNGDNYDQSGNGYIWPVRSGQ